MSKLILLLLVGVCLLISFPTTAIASTDNLIESGHPYANNFQYTWPAITEPGATQMKLHFSKLELATDASYGDKLILSDEEGKELKTYTHYDTGDDFWTEWYTGDTLKVKLTTNGFSTAYGFKIDQVDTRNAPASTPTENSMSDTTTALTFSNSQCEFGQQIVFTARIDPTQQLTEMLSGTVTFFDGTTLIGTGDVISGQSTLTISSLSVGSH